MQAELVKNLCVCLSNDRLNAYKTGACRTESDILSRYLWNIALCEALYPPLNMLEIGLRNRCDFALTMKFGTRWLEEDKVGFRDYQKARILEAQAELAKHKKGRDHGRLVAELHFGFWTSLFNKDFERAWHSILKHAFPYLPGPMRTRARVAERLASIRKFRNRVFHHERIIHQPHMRIHRDLCEAIGWLGAEYSKLADACDRVKKVYNEGPERMLAPLNGAFPDHGFVESPSETA